MKSLIVVFLCVSSIWASPRSVDPRIVGGENARAGQFPFAAAITVTTPNARFFCGGSLVNNRWILTAAQCVDGATLFSIRLGSNSLVGNDPNRVTLATSDYVIHPDYNSGTLENDLALIELRLPITFNDYVRISYLPTIDYPASTSVISIGWGQTNDSLSGNTNELQYVELSTLSTEECRVTYGSSITDNMVCASGNYNEGTCLDDVGGPLLHYVSPKYTVIVGVSSFLSQNGCESTDPSGFTKISPYLDWIRSVIDA